ncbi:MAG: THUMP domain-containing protein [Candidatus Micrarchaeales archaeon]|nr:THUMP domain-containing protein [Candidatus Micrarchaeales archaeon]
MPTQYLIFCDKRFLRSAVKELAAVYPNLKIESADSSGRFLIASSKTEAKPSADLVFVENVVPVSIELEGVKYKSKELLIALQEIIRRKDRFKIEALNLSSHSGANAKTIEVFLGQALEKQGLVADLKNPTLLVYVVLAGDDIFICKTDEQYVLDAFRANKFGKDEKISRAEFKLKEAIDYFGIDRGKIKLALDIGAAPGGWSNHMAKQGAKVIAVDNAALAYEKLDMKRIVHIPKRAQDIDMESLKKFDVDILLMDMNIAPSDSAALAVRFADILKKGAFLILTIKLVDLRIEKHIKDAKEILSKEYRGIRLKKLPHNRQELTLFAIKK